MANLLLFVCTGNTCRSPLAEGMASQWFKKNAHEGWEVRSAGTFATDGCPTSLETVEALRNHGIEFVGTSNALTKELVDLATVVLCMTANHCMDVVSIAENPTKVELVDPEGSINDPIGCDQSVYDALATRFAQIIPQRLSEIIERRKNNEVLP